jgi:3D (Asp-Asp-Asp) domain-containing protein
MRTSVARLEAIPSDGMGRTACLLLSCGVLFPALLAAGCGGGWGGGSKWVAQPLDEDGSSSSGMTAPIESQESMRGVRPGSRTLGAPSGKRANAEVDRTGGGGRPLGTFRNTYYDFPREGDHSGAAVPLMSASCQPIAQVPRSFYEAVCVQGSGTLKRGGTVSFSKRDCACAEVCPRTGQRICFDALDATAFPWGRGAAGTPITPMRTLAADTSILPMGTVVYIPELDGAPRDESGDAHDGCFVVEDRGLKVKGEHVDIFTGFAASTALMNERVPSNQGVTVVVSAPRCAHLKPR